MFCLVAIHAVAVFILMDAGYSHAASDDWVTFTDVTEASGISFRHVAGMTGRKHIAETMGSGAAFLDFDGDEKNEKRSEMSEASFT